MKKPFISGIQQMGVGVADVHEAWKWYRKNIGMDVPIFEEAAEAGLMLPYTGGMPHQRHAILAINMNGGGGFEIWQYTSRVPQKSDFEILPGDLGINMTKIKSKDVLKTYDFMKNNKVNVSPQVYQSPEGKNHFYFLDPYQNLFEVVENESWFGNTNSYTGGPCGAVIGVKDMEKSIDFYKNILNYDRVIYDQTRQFSDFASLKGGESVFRRVLLRSSVEPIGSFSQLLGTSEIELIQVKGREPRHIYQDRFWGDLGFIHLCFDIIGMDEMRKKCDTYGVPFTVDSSNSFDMGEAAGHFSYIEDPNGTLIEFVETHKIPILKKLGWYLDLTKRDPTKPLPKIMLKALALNRKKD